MSHIVMCEGVDCPIRGKCYRYTAVPDFYKYYFIETPFKYDFCDKFISLEEENDLTTKKMVSWRT